MLRTDGTNKHSICGLEVSIIEMVKVFIGMQLHRHEGAFMLSLHSHNMVNDSSSELIGSLVTPCIWMQNNGAY